MSKRSSARKKNATPVSDEEEMSEEETEIVSLSDGDESVEEIVAPKKQRSACSYNKAAFSMPDDISKLMNRVLCTACGKQLNPMNHKAVRRHPWLKVVTCKKCYKFLKSGPFTRDTEGTDEQCRWCGDGGRLYGCDFCHNCFCRSCIKRNLGRSEAAEMENEDSKSKWKCYMCQPKKIKSLVENCTKILDYIKKEEEKEKQREERAKQREKDKALASKEKRASSLNGTEKSNDKKEQKSGLPIPKIQKEVPSIKISLPAPKAKDCIVIDESPEKSIKPVTAKSYGYNSRPGDGVTKVQPMGNGVTGVVVGPKAKMPVTMPYKESMSVASQALKTPSLYGMLNSHTPKVPLMNANMIDHKQIATMPKVNDIRALKDQIVPFNVETITEKMSTVAQSFSLMLNSVKTDLAIARLSSSNLYQSRNSAAFSVKAGLESFFNNIRDIFKVQIVMASPNINDAVNPIKIEDEPDSKNLRGLLNGSNTTESRKEDFVKEEDLIVKREVKMETEEQKNINDSAEESQKESADVKEIINTGKAEIPKMETDQDNEKEESKSVNNKEEKENRNMDSEMNISSPEDLEKESEKNPKEMNSKKVASKQDTRQKNTPTKPADKSEKGSRRVSRSKSNLEDVDKKSEKNENTAAELDLLKELADEINDLNDKDEEQEEILETRRSSRRSTSQTDNEDKKSEDAQEKGSGRKKSEKLKSGSQLDKRDEKSKPRNDSEVDSEKKHSKGKDESSKKVQEDKIPSGTNHVRDNTSDMEEEEISSDTDSSSSSIVFGKRKKKRKSKATKEKEAEDEVGSSKNDEPEEMVKTLRSSGRARSVAENKGKEELSKHSKTSRHSKQEKNAKKEDGTSKKEKSEKQVDNHSDSDADVERDIKSLAKESKLRHRKTGSNDKEKKEEKEESRGEKKSKSEKTRKESSEAKEEKKATKKQEDDHSDSSNFDSDLEKDIKSFSKDTKLRERKTRSTTEQKKPETEEAKAEKTTKPRKSKKDTTTEDSVDSDDSDDDETDTHSPDADDMEENGEEEEEEEQEEDQDEDELSPTQITKLKAAQKKTEEDSDYEDMVASEDSDSEDPEVSFPKLETPKKGEKKKGKEEDSDDSDFVTPKKKKTKKLKSDLLDANLSGSDSDVGPKTKKKSRGRKRKKEEEEDEELDPEDEVYSDDNKKKKKGKGKRKRIKKIVSSSDEEVEKKEAEGGEEEEQDLEDTPGGAHKRRKIRKVMANKKLADSTKEARKAEDERRKRIEERQKEFNAYVEVEGGESEGEIPEGTEREKKDKEEDSISQILGSPRKVPVTTKCVLDMEKESKKILIEINRTLVKKLKPHQVEAVRFMYNCCVESVERLKKEEGAGCILAHCMGLGKTLSVITFLHTMLSNVKLTKMTKCLVVCPLNTVLNWVNEFEIWLDDVDYEIDIYEMSKVKQNYERAQMLREWHEGKAGVMILGYDMYRNLVMGSHCKNKKQKATFYEALADPGPDIVVCDEGHILKNDSTSLSKAMSKIVSKRRVVLTGTPLQNNLNEYHCMVNFVKPNLLGTRKEFSNRFVNPITNGQCTDSSASDVKLMKRRAHILHEMLAGCVQRKDYSALTKFLPPKFEYVISVRMGKLQCTLYENYLKEVGVVMNEEIQGKGGRLFRDYQALMRIWTHPWVLKLDEIRQENKKTYDSEDSFIDDEESEEDSFVSASTTSESEDSDMDVKKKKSRGRGKRKKRGSGSSSDEGKDGNEDNEVVKKWTSKTRGNEEGAGSSWMADMGYSTGPKEVSSEWWAEYVKEEDEFKIELSGKITLLFEILKMCEDIGDKVLVFSQSLLSLDIIEDFLHHVDETSNKEEGQDDDKKSEEDSNTDKKDDKGSKTDKKDDDGSKTDKEDDKKKDKYADYGKSWTLGADYFRMDGSTNSQQRKAAQDSFNDPDNFRARLFLISTKAGSLGINLVAANRVIIFDASWNPSHDIQSIFRVYRFGQVKPVYVYRFLAQGTMEEKIYERQVTKQSLSQRVVDEHQIERHFTSNDLQELYKFQPDRLDDPDRKEIPLPMLPKDHMLAELMSTQKDWIVTFHEHDSLLENIVEQELSEEEKKAAWEDYENEKKGLNTAFPMYGNMMMNNQAQRMSSALEFQNLVLQGQASLGQDAVIQIVQDLKTRFPHLPPEVFSQRVQAVLRQVLTQRIMHQSDLQRRQLDQQKMAELNRLNQIKQQIQQQQALINSQQRGMGLQGFSSNSLYGVQALPSSGYYNSVMPRPGAMNFPTPPPAHSSSKPQQKSNSKGDK